MLNQEFEAAMKIPQNLIVCCCCFQKNTSADLIEPLHGTHLIDLSTHTNICINNAVYFPPPPVVKRAMDEAEEKENNQISQLLKQ